MPIQYHETSQTFHLTNRWFSYIFKINHEGYLIQLYCGSRIRDKENFDELYELACRPMATNYYQDDRTYSLEHLKQEFPGAFGADMRKGAIEIEGKDGTKYTDFRFESFRIEPGKLELEGLPACYVEEEAEATTLVITLKDEHLQVRAHLLYTLYEQLPVLTRSVRVENDSENEVRIEALTSLNVDLPDDNYERLMLTGAWARERHIEWEPLHSGYQSVYSLRGHSSHNFNPFLALKRPSTTEESGEVLGFALIYSGNFEASVDVDTYHTSRIQIGMNRDTFAWLLEPGTSFQSPEAVMVYSDQGLNKMSQAFHTLFGRRLARGVWRDKARPILLNSWEGVYFDFTEEKILNMAKEAANLGVELFVLDDGWFQGRNSDWTSLGDWVADEEKLPDGLDTLCSKICDLGLKFGLWIEPEMVNVESDLYRAHPDWRLEIAGRHISAGRHQYVLDFTNPAVVDAVAKMLFKVFDGLNISYVKWDMNRSLTEVGSTYWNASHQQSLYHRFILGVYDLYERLIERYPNILFESCASGGGRFDPGMMYYAPQAWTSDDTDGVERLKIQYGTSMLYPISSMGSHVSASPNHQLHRNTPLEFRADVAYFGTFGYELNPASLSDEEKVLVKEQIRFMKEYRELIQLGTFYRLKSPFEGNETAWMVVSQDRKIAIVAYYRVIQEINTAYRRLPLQGLDPEQTYTVSDRDGMFYGDELEKIGLIISDSSASENNDGKNEGDFLSRMWILKAV